MNGLEAEAKATSGRGQRGLSRRLAGLAAQIHEHHEVEVLIPLAVPAGWEGRATGVVDRTPPVHHVHGGRATILVEPNDETTGAAWHRPALDLGGLCKRVVGILCEFQQHAVVSVAVAVHQFVDPSP